MITLTKSYMNHCKAAKVPIITILGPSPVQIFRRPRAFAAEATVVPCDLFM